MSNGNDLGLLPPAPTVYNQTVIQRAITVLQQTFSNYTSVKNAALNASYLLANKTTPVSNINTSADTLMSYAIPANTIARIGTFIQIQAFGTIAANTDHKQIELYFGSTLIGNSTSQAANNGNWSFTSSITVTGTNAEQAITNFNSDNASYTNGTNYVMATETLSAILTIKVVATAAAASDVTQNGLFVTVYPANPLTT